MLRSLPSLIPCVKQYFLLVILRGATLVFEVPGTNRHRYRYFSILLDVSTGIVPVLQSSPLTWLPPGLSPVGRAANEPDPSRKMLPFLY
jgi:hypothetical protein